MSNINGCIAHLCNDERQAGSGFCSGHLAEFIADECSSKLADLIAHSQGGK